MPFQSLTLAQKQAAAEDYAALGSYRAVAAKHGISPYSVRKAVLEFGAQSGAGVPEARQSVTDYLDSQRGRLKCSLSLLLDNLCDPERVSELNAQQSAQAFKAVSDKALSLEERAVDAVAIIFGSLPPDDIRRFGV